MNLIWQVVKHPATAIIFSLVMAALSFNQKTKVISPTFLIIAWIIGNLGLFRLENPLVQMWLKYLTSAIFGFSLFLIFKWVHHEESMRRLFVLNPSEFFNQGGRISLEETSRTLYGELRTVDHPDSKYAESLGSPPSEIVETMALVIITDLRIPLFGKRKPSPKYEVINETVRKSFRNPTFKNGIASIDCTHVGNEGTFTDLSVRKNDLSAFIREKKREVASAEKK